MTTNLRTTFLILCGGAVGMGALLALLPAAGHDQLWCLYVARRVLDGSRLYGPELMESNPPLIVWLSMVPAGMARVVGVGAPAIGKALVVVLQGGMALVCLRQVRRVMSLSRTQVAALGFVFVVLFDVVPARDLGQRDYLLALLCLPYLLGAAGRAAEMFSGGWVEGVVVGLAAGVGLALKPQQAILAVAVEVYMVVRARSWRTLLRPEPVAIAVVAVGYFAAIRSFTPGYLTVVLPVLRDTYWAVGSVGVGGLIWQAVELHVLGAVAVWVVVARRKGLAGRWGLNAGPLFVVAGCASTVAYYVQGTGWYYQQLPGIVGFALALAFELLPVAERPVRGWVPKAAAGLAVLALGLTTHFMGYPFTEARSFGIVTPDPGFFEGLAPGTPVATLTTTVDYTVMPAARFYLTIAQRYPHLWMLPAILRSEEPGVGSRRVIAPGRLAELDRMQHEFMVEDLRRWQPEVVLVERCVRASGACQLLDDRDVDLLAWFLRDPAFAAEWQKYGYSGSRGRFDGYRRKR